MLNAVAFGDGWHNIHDNAYLVSQGVEHGDQLLITVLTNTARLHFGDTEPTDVSGFERIETDESNMTVEGLDCWILGPTKIQVEYAP